MGRPKKSEATEPILEAVNNGWRLTERVGVSTLRIECVKCKRKRVTRPYEFFEHKRQACLCTFEGKSFGRLTVMTGQINRMLKCSCSCGNVVWIRAHQWGVRRSCGCLREEFLQFNKTFINLIGKRFGKLKVVGLNRVVDYVGTRQYFWNCLCKCGAEHVVAGSNLKAKLIKHCPACRKPHWKTVAAKAKRGR